MLVKIGHRPIKNIKEGDLHVSKNKVKTLKRGEYILNGYCGGKGFFLKNKIQPTKKHEMCLYLTVICVCYRQPGSDELLRAGYPSRSC